MGLKDRGLTLIEVIVGLGILGLALLALTTLIASSLKYQRQTQNSSLAVRVNDMILERAVSSIVNDSPPGARESFWDREYPYPANAYQRGEQRVGRELFQYAVYAVEVPGIGNAAASPPNLLKKIDVYVWWEDKGQVGQKRTYSTRLLNSEEES